MKALGSHERISVHCSFFSAGLKPIPEAAISQLKNMKN